MSYSKWYQFIEAAHTEAEIKQFISSNAPDLNDSFRSDYEGIGISFNGRFNPLRIAIEAGKEIFVKCLLLAGPTFNMNDYTLGFQRQEILERQFIEVMKKVDAILSEEERAALIKKDHKMTLHLKTKPSKTADKTTSHAVPPITQESHLSGITTSHLFPTLATPPAQSDLLLSNPPQPSGLNVSHAAKPAAFFSANPGNNPPPVSVGVSPYTKWCRFIIHEVHSETEIKQFITANSADLTDSFKSGFDGNKFTSNGRFNPLRIAIEAGAIIHVKCLLLAGSIFKKDGYSLGYNDQEKLENQFRDVIGRVLAISYAAEIDMILNRDPKIPEYLKAKTPNVSDETPSYNIRYRF